MSPEEQAEEMLAYQKPRFRQRRQLTDMLRSKDYPKKP
jgi:hypothetical protein